MSTKRLSIEPEGFWLKLRFAYDRDFQALIREALDARWINDRRERGAGYWRVGIECEAELLTIAKRKGYELEVC